MWTSWFAPAATAAGSPPPPPPPPPPPVLQPVERSVPLEWGKLKQLVLTSSAAAAAAATAIGDRGGEDDGVDTYSLCDFDSVTGLWVDTGLPDVRAHQVIEYIDVAIGCCVINRISREVLRRFEEDVSCQTRIDSTTGRTQHWVPLLWATPPPPPPQCTSRSLLLGVSSCQVVISVRLPSFEGADAPVAPCLTVTGVRGTYDACNGCGETTITQYFSSEPVSMTCHTDASDVMTVSDPLDRVLCGHENLDLTAPYVSFMFFADTNGYFAIPMHWTNVVTVFSGDSPTTPTASSHLVGTCRTRHDVAFGRHTSPGGCTIFESEDVATTGVMDRDGGGGGGATRVPACHVHSLDDDDDDDDDDNDDDDDDGGDGNTCNNTSGGWSFWRTGAPRRVALSVHDSSVSRVKSVRVFGFRVRRLLTVNGLLSLEPPPPQETTASVN